jgi:hypothetical protein
MKLQWWIWKEITGYFENDQLNEKIVQSFGQLALLSNT